MVHGFTEVFSNLLYFKHASVVDLRFVIRSEGKNGYLEINIVLLIFWNIRVKNCLFFSPLDKCSQNVDKLLEHV